MKKILVLLSILLISSLAFGQAETTGRITGTVVSEDDQPIAGALVTVQSPALLGERQQRTNERGDFLFALLPVGPYRVTIAAPGKQSMDFSFQLNLGQTVPLNAVMKDGQDITEEITVLGTATRFETTAGGENFSLDTTVEELPIQNRRLENIAFNAPNMSSGPNTTPRISGANAFDTLVLLDGAEISDPLFGGGTGVYIEDAIEEVQVLTSGVSARYGRFQGGVLNAITKTGGNEFTATVRAEYYNEDWDSQTPFEEENDVAKNDDLNYQVMGIVGGYVMRDRLWFFGSTWYQPDSSSSRTAASGQSYQRVDSEERFQLKLRGAITPDHVIDASYLDYDSTVTGYAGLPAGDANFANNGSRGDPRDMTTVTYQGVLSGSLFVDAMYTAKNASIVSGGNPSAGTPIYVWPDFQFYHNMWWDATDETLRNNKTYSANMTYTLPTDTMGSHTIEAGYQRVESTTGGENRQSSTGFNFLSIANSNFVISDPETGVPIVQDDGEVHFNLTNGSYARLWVGLDIGGDQTVDYDALYVQDSWEIGDWRVDAGVRYEQYGGEGPSTTDLIDFTAFSPRLGVTYNINQDWQIQTSWGHYQGRFNDKYAQGATGIGSAPSYGLFGYIGPECLDCTGDELDPLVTNLDNWFGTYFYDDPASFPTTVLDPDLESAYAKDFNFSVKRALPGNSGTLEVRYTKRDFEDLVDDYVGGDFQEYVDVVADGTNWGSFDQTTWANASNAKRAYEAVTVAWEYRPSVTWNIGGNYTWSTLDGNYTGEGTNTPASGSAIGDYPLNTPPSAAAPVGFLPGDMRHRARVWGNYRLDFERAGNLSLGGLLRYSDGLPWTRVASVDRWVDDAAALDDLSNTFTYYFEDRGANRFASSWAFDFSARYQIQVWKDLRAWFKVNVINILDNDKKISFATNGVAQTTTADLYDTDGNLVAEDAAEVPFAWAEASNFGRVDAGDYQTPRTFLLTIGASWK